MKLSPRSLLVLAAAALLVAGCKPSVVGKWQGNVNVGNTSLSATMEFTRDGKVSASATTPFGAVQSSGTYTDQGDKLTINMGQPTINGKTSPLLSQMGIKGPLNGTQTYKIEGETLTLGNATLTRVKQ